ncbi:MAG: hypothetical protein ABFS37_00135 [Acidobacteriota bacterium]
MSHEHREQLDSGGPRVVILEAEDGPSVEVLDLPRTAGIGSSFCHHGTSWTVTDLRTHDRVLICSHSEGSRSLLRG